jgi:hypothetical protein
LNTNYVVAIQHKIEMGALLDADGLPTGVTVSPIDDDFVLGVGGTNDWDATTFGTGVSGAVDGYIGLTCDDTTRAHTFGGTDVETLSVSSNNYAYSTAGSLATITSTAYDQYGDGIAGVVSQFTRRAVSSIGANTDTADVAQLTSGANGTASLSAVVCATGGEVRNEWSITDPGASFMDGIAATPPNALAVEGTTMYCTSAGTDAETPYQQVGTVQGIVTITTNDACADANAGTLTITIANARGYLTDTTATTEAFLNAELVDAAIDAADNVSIHHEISALANVPAATTTLAATSGNTCVYTITFPANTGAWTVTAASTLGASGSADGSITATVAGVTGTAPIAFTFIDDDLSTNTIVTGHTITTASTAGASEVTTKYQTWAYDSTDQFNVDNGDDDIATSITAATEAQFETANAGLNDLTSHMTLTYRTGALTTGVSVWTIGT